MAGKINRSTKQILSVLFHLVVLVSMVLIYDAGKLIAVKLGVIDPPEKKLAADGGEGSELNFMEQEDVLPVEINPELGKLIKKDGDGYIFRTDIAFPPHLKVVVSKVKKFKKVRVAGKSEFGDDIDVLSARKDDVTEYEMAGNAVRITKREGVRKRLLGFKEKMEIEKAAEEAAAAGKSVPERRDEIVDTLKGKVVQFSNDGKKWKAVKTSQFITRAWSAELEPEIGRILVENSLQPVSRWFGDKPVKSGSKQKLSGGSLALVIRNTASGSLDLEMTGMEGIHGHPCAAFSVEGSVVMKPYTNDLGQSIEREITVEDGKVWFSLLYPIVLRIDMETIQSVETKEGGKKIGVLQGAVREHVHVDWKAVGKEK